MKPPSNVKTPEQYIASLPADRAKPIAVRSLVNKHIPGGYDECLVWGTFWSPSQLEHLKGGKRLAS